MIHETTISRHWGNDGKPFFWVRCTCARYEAACPSRAKAEAKARQHERGAH